MLDPLVAQLSLEKDPAPFNRPDLEEFLTALNGFLDKPSPSTNSNYIRFLEIFCRSVGAFMGHLLVSSRPGQLESTMSCGISPGFDKEFNEVHFSQKALCPLDVALRQKKVVAMVDLKNETGIPEWFMQIMDRYNFKSLVAVPLLGPTHPVGVLCAYYRDVCLFDQGTIDRLLVMGRMVGSATEKSQAADLVESHDTMEKVADDLIAALAAKPFNKLQLFSMLNKAIKQSFGSITAICGPIRKISDRLALTVVAGTNIPNTAITHKFVLPPFLEKKLTTGQWPKNLVSIGAKDFGYLQSLTEGQSFKVMCAPILWQGKLLGAIIAWRAHTMPFTKLDEQLLDRLSGIAALALNVA